MRHGLLSRTTAVAALITVTICGAGTAAAEPALQLSQSTGVREGQSVTVALTGLPADLTSVAVAQCKSHVTTPMDCNLPGALMGNADAQGVWRPNGDKRALIVASSIGATNCVSSAGACSISVTSLTNPAAIIVSIPLTFGDPAERAKPEVAEQSSASADDSDNTPLVVGTVVAVVAILIATTIGVVLRRRTRRR